jgi:hypothetical protein
VKDAILCDEPTSGMNFAGWLLPKRRAHADLSATLSWQYVRIFTQRALRIISARRQPCPFRAYRVILRSLSSVIRAPGERDRNVGLVNWLLIPM